MLSPVRILLCAFLIASAHAQCPVDTVILKGRVENPSSHSRIHAQLLYPNHQPGESAEVDAENGTFRLPIEFLTQSSRPLLRNLKPKCDRKPTAVVVKLFDGDQENDSVTLDFHRDFKMTDLSAYTLQSDLVLKNSH